MVTIAGISNFGESPRKAPVPPAQTNATTANITSTLSRRSSLSQSMMRTLNGRKKDTKPPAPLNVSIPSPHILPLLRSHDALLQLPPSVPTVPARYDVAPIVHHLDRPLARRRESTTGNCIAASPGLAHTAGSSPNTHSNDDRPPSRGSLGILFRSVRKSISRRASKASPSLQAQGSTPGSRSGAGSIKSNAPSFVNVQVETFMEVQSTPSSPAIDRKAALQAINPDSQAAAIASRPQTAPAGGRKEHSFKLQIPSLSQKSTPTSSKYSSPLTGQESRLGGFQIQYTDPWQKTSAFQPASDYSLVQTFPPSPPSRTTKQKGIASLPRDEREKQEYMDSKRSAGPIQSSSSDDSASPTSIPSWTPMMALPSPNVSVIVEQTPPPVSFLDLEATPAPFVKVASSISGLGQPSNLPESNKSAFYLTPGRVSMRDPWAKSSRSNESSRNKSTCSRGDLGTTSLGETLNASNRSPSSIESFASPGLAASPQSRQLSRKAVPKIDEREIIATSTQENEYGDTTSNKIYAGCRPFRRPSAEQQLSDRSTDKSMFKTRASLGNVREGYVEEYIPEVGRSQSLAGRGNVILPPAPAEDGEAWYNRVGRPSYPVFENTYSLRRPSYASERSNQSFPSKPTRLEFRRPSTLAQSDGMRVSFDATTDL